jgi:uncharacterized membrane protein YfcA
MEIWQYLLLAALGVAAGIVNVIAGGGTLLTLPAMILMGVDPQTANGTNRIAILAQNLTAIASFRKRGFSDFRLSITLALATLPGAIAGAMAGTRIDGELFNRLLAVVMICVIVMMVVKRLRKKRGRGQDAVAEKSAPEKTDDSTTGPPSCEGGYGVTLDRGRWIAGHLCMVGVGFYGGFIQAGVGFLFIAVMHNIMGINLVRVNMHKVFVIAVYTLAALSVFLVKGNVLWPLGLVVAVGNSVGGWIGAHLSVNKGEGFIRVVIEIALAAMAVKLLLG